jgi:hypothetical protein
MLIHVLWLTGIGKEREGHVMVLPLLAGIDVSLALSALAAFVSGLVMFVLVGFRGDVRDVRKDVGELQGRVGNLEGRVEEHHGLERRRYPRFSPEDEEK